ncbi:MAG: 50S ribosomal protein L3 [Candidatus Bathyarchaeota archaeon]|nr:MAG: 50S ribosomal protein L3 [Candidatus Bathyarchaeota archaeon]
MGHRKKHAPKRGSLAYLPRGRAARETGRIRYWPSKAEGPTLLGFMGYKAGMTHLFYLDDHPRSPNFGKEVNQPVTVIETPPILVYAIRAYIRTDYGLKSFTEAWMKNPSKDLKKVFTLPENFDPESGLKKIEERLDDIVELRLLTVSQPRLANISKKKPELMEIKVDGAPIQELFEYSKGLLGKAAGVMEVFKEGQFVDVVAVTKGKGFQGPVKRWGVRILQRKSRKTKRGVAVIGPWKPPRVLYTVPRAGQMGYHQRTEYNKRILRIGVDGKEVTPNGGFVKYGVVRGPFVLLKGSVPGPAKRLIRLRVPARPKKVPAEPPKIVSVSLESKQG